MKRYKRLTGLLLAAALMLSLTGCEKKYETVRIASKPMTEQFILTEMLKLLIENDTNLKVEITKGVGGGTTNIHPAMLNAEFDIYPEYTRTAWFSVLKKQEDTDDETLYKELQQEYEKLGLVFTGLYGFSNSYSLALRRETAEEYKLKTFSDLAAVSDQLVFGGNYDYIEKEDGYPLLCSAYGMNFRDTVDMEIALKYKALEQKEIDVMNAFTTDAQLTNEELVLLKDDKGFFSTYLAGTVVRQEILDKYPELNGVFEKMRGIITEADMIIMNYDVEVLGIEDAVVAKEYLQSKGLLK